MGKISAPTLSLPATASQQLCQMAASFPVARVTTQSEQLPYEQVKAGLNQADWEKSGWIAAQDPRGWFHWYCRFYQVSFLGPFVYLWHEIVVGQCVRLAPA